MFKHSTCHGNSESFEDPLMHINELNKHINDLYLIFMIYISRALQPKLFNISLKINKLIYLNNILDGIIHQWPRPTLNVTYSVLCSLMWFKYIKKNKIMWFLSCIVSIIIHSIAQWLMHSHWTIWSLILQ